MQLETIGLLAVEATRATRQLAGVQEHIRIGKAGPGSAHDARHAAFQAQEALASAVEDYEAELKADAEGRERAEAEGIGVATALDPNVPSDPQPGELTGPIGADVAPIPPDRFATDEEASDSAARMADTYRGSLERLGAGDGDTSSVAAAEPAAGVHEG